MGHSIVVDACVARSAGPNRNPIAQNCYKVLLAIIQYDHRLAMSHQVESEWMEYKKRASGKIFPNASYFALEWYQEMKSKGRVDYYLVDLDSDLRKDVEQDLINNHITKSVAKEIMEDLHLIETALKSDNRVLSSDDEMYDNLLNLQDTSQDLNVVMWVSPNRNNAYKWLRDNAPDIPDYHICQGAPP